MRGGANKAVFNYPKAAALQAIPPDLMIREFPPS